jgi:hypothetical protein
MATGYFETSGTIHPKIASQDSNFCKITMPVLDKNPGLDEHEAVVTATFSNDVSDSAAWNVTKFLIAAI